MPSGVLRRSKTHYRLLASATAPSAVTEPLAGDQHQVSHCLQLASAAASIVQILVQICPSMRIAVRVEVPLCVRLEENTQFDSAPGHQECFRENANPCRLAFSFLRQKVRASVYFRYGPKLRQPISTQRNRCRLSIDRCRWNLQQNSRPTLSPSGDDLPCIAHLSVQRIGSGLKKPQMHPKSVRVVGFEQVAKFVPNHVSHQITRKK